MMHGMNQAAQHQFYRHPAIPWAELRVSLQSPHCYKLHMHAEYSLGLVDAGRATFQHPNGPQQLEAGDVVLIEPRVWHACNPVALTQWSYRMLYLQADWLHTQFDCTDLRFVQRAVRSPRYHRLLGVLCQQLMEGDLNPAAWSAQLHQLLHDSNLLAPAAPSLPNAQSNSAVQRALECLHQCPERAPSIQSLAQHQGMSAARFIRQFKAATGVTPGSYRLNLRLNGARHLLAQGCSLADAAHAMGFADQAHLQRAFKAHHATTPGRYTPRP